MYRPVGCGPRGSLFAHGVPSLRTDRSQKDIPMIRIAGLIILTLTLAAERGLAQDRSHPGPSLILINIDDLGYGDIGPFGSVANKTPQLDRMATEGRRLTSHYAAPVCSPSRAAMMTGCYPKRALPVPHVLFPSSAVGLNPEEITVAEILRDAGYATACIGKWHLGDQPEFLPTEQGFDSYFGLPYSNDMGTAAEGSKSNPDRPLPKAKPTPPDGKPVPEDGLRGNAQPPLPLLRNRTVIERVTADGQTTITERYTAEAIRFIEANRERKFFLYLPHTAVHFPLYPGMEFREKSGNGLYSDWVTEVDWSVGRVLDTIRALDLSGNTLVVFTSDNGGAPRFGASNAPLRGTKGQTWEGGIRVPTIVWWPGHVPAGSSTDAITSHMDWLPTFSELAGTAAPGDRVIDGVNILSVLLGTDASPPRTEFCFFRGFALEAVRQNQWKLHLEKGELFDLQTDISESTNVASRHPEVVAALQSLADAMNEDLGRSDFGPGVRPLGRVENPQPLISPDGDIRNGFAPVPSGR